MRRAKETVRRLKAMALVKLIQLIDDDRVKVTLGRRLVFSSESRSAIETAVSKVPEVYIRKTKFYQGDGKYSCCISYQWRNKAQNKTDR